MSVLDVGVTNELIRKVPEATNYFLKNFKIPQSQYTGLSIEQTAGMDTYYPNCRFVSYPGWAIPF